MVKTFPIHLEPDLHEELKRYTFENKISMKDFILAAIVEKLEKLKDTK